MNLLEQMLQLQHSLQTDVYGYDFSNMTDVERVAYVKDMMLAAQGELHEALDEVNWKPWSTKSGIQNEDAFFSELIDAWQFIMNMMLVIGTPEYVTTRLHVGHARKVEINRKRHEARYDGRSTKCHQCKRALDDPAVHCTRTGDQGWCETYQVNINFIQVTGGEDAHVRVRDTVAP